MKIRSFVVLASLSAILVGRPANAHGSTVLGSAIGAAVGSAIGQNAGGRDGAVFGGAIGGAIGASVGNDLDRQHEFESRHREHEEPCDRDDDHWERHEHHHHHHYYSAYREPTVIVVPRGHAWGHRRWRRNHDRYYAFERD